MKFDTLEDKVVVITGASSGIGKFAAEEFLKAGARVAMAARSLDEMEEHLMTLGLDAEHALAIRTDVSRFEEVSSLARQARAHFGKIDIWVNNAAVSLYGRLDELEPDEISRVIDVNLKGQMFGSKVALSVFKSHGYGNLVNVSSVVGKVAVPLQSAYVATKHGIVGFTAALREELIGEGEAYRDISVSTVLPASMDTPLFTHAKSKPGMQPYPILPIYDPMVTVQAILKCAKRPMPEVIAGGAGRTLVNMARLSPRLAEWYMGKTALEQQKTDIPKPLDEHNLFAPLRNSHDVRGGIGTTREHLIDEMRQHPVRTGLMAALPLALGAVAVGLLRRQAMDG